MKQATLMALKGNKQMKVQSPRRLLVEPLLRESFDVSTQNGITTLCAEASSLSNGSGTSRHLEQLYDDSNDRGLAIEVRHGAKAQVLTFGLFKVNRGTNGEIQSWDYRPTADSLQEFPSAKNTRVRVFND